MGVQYHEPGSKSAFCAGLDIRSHYTCGFVLKRFNHPLNTVRSRALILRLNVVKLPTEFLNSCASSSNVRGVFSAFFILWLD